ncbi:MAG TPA: NAD(P)/FAD-dependent oxidoreductase [Firmicutes bacterium]|nr:NAD(P)/FAD-dependent oxidoreductase [Bacillota bacterium]
MKYVIVGNGAAGISALKVIRAKDPSGEITIIGDEPHPFYSRVLTSHLIGGKVSLGDLFIEGEDVCQRYNARQLLATKAEKVDTASKTIYLSDGSELQYDKLLLATGASAQELSVPGSALLGVFTLRTLNDAVNIKSWSEGLKSAVVVGGGLVGFKAMEALLQRGLSVSMVVSSPQVLSRVLDPTGSELVLHHLESIGVEVLLREDVAELYGGGRVSSLRLKSGKVLDCKLVVVGKGVVPNISLAKEAGLACNRGILVDDRMATSAPDVYAAGDVVECWDAAAGGNRVNALWYNAIQQGKVAGHNMAGEEVHYSHSIAMNSLSIGDLTIYTMGVTQPSGSGFTEKKYLNKRKRQYRKLVYRSGRLVGAIVIGEDRRVGMARCAIAYGKEKQPIYRLIA